MSLNSLLGRSVSMKQQHYALLAALLLLPVSNAWSQALEEITVTAQKRVQTAQDVPLAVTAVSGEVLDDFGITNFDGLDVPGLIVQRGGMADVVTIRGVGSDTNLGFEQSVPTYIDGVYYGRARIQRYAFLDVERIEVLKGPQPTYLGKNAVAGAINITTRKPGDEFAANVSVLNEFEHDELIIEGGVDVPLGEGVSLRLAGKFRDMDGWMDNIATGASEPKVEDQLFRATLVADLTENIGATLQVYQGNNEDDGRNNQPFNCQDTFFDAGISDPALEDCVIDTTKAARGAVPSTPSGGDTELFFQSSNGTFLNDLEITGASLHLDIGLGEYELTSVTSYYEFENRLQAEGDHGTSNFFTANFVEDFDQVSQEFRLLSPRGETIEWAAGVYFDSNTNDNLQAPNINSGELAFIFPGVPAMGMALTRHRDVDESADSWGVFADVTYNVSETVRASFGVRYTEIEKDASILVCAAAVFTRNCNVSPPNQTGAAFTFTDSRKDTDTQPSFVLEWEPNDSLNAYFSYKEGFKAGGFDHSLNAPNFDAFSYEPEEVTALELGAKFRLMDGRARLDLALFDNTFDNLQVSIFSGVGINFNVANAAESESRGLEVDADFAATDSLTLGASLQWLNAEFSSYSGAPCYTRQTAAEGCLPDGGTTTQDLTGRPRPLAPDFTATLKANWDAPLNNNLNLTGGLELYISDSFFTIADLDPVSVQPSYEKLNARVGIGSSDGRWEVALVGRNLTDELTAPWRGDCPFGVCTIALVDRTRTVGLQLSADF